MKQYCVIVICNVPADSKIEAEVQAQDNPGYYLVKTVSIELPFQYASGALRTKEEDEL